MMTGVVLPNGARSQWAMGRINEPVAGTIIFSAGPVMGWCRSRAVADQVGGPHYRLIGICARPRPDIIGFTSFTIVAR